MAKKILDRLVRGEPNPYELAMLAATVDPYTASVEPYKAIVMALELLAAAKEELEAGEDEE